MECKHTFGLNSDKHSIENDDQKFVISSFYCFSQKNNKMKF